MRVLVALLLLGALLAGCSDGADTATDTLGADVGKVGATSGTGGIRGVVVDQAIVPVSGAKVLISNGPNATTDKAGAFVLSNLAPGAYFLKVSKPGYTTVQQAATVEAGVEEPPIVKVIVQRIPGSDPFVEEWRLDGFYECGFGLPVITDQCDFGVRTVYDGANGTVPGYPGPRNVLQGINTQFFDVAPSATSVIQEAFWTDETVAQMMIELDATPIDNACDCSDTYLGTTGPKPTYARLDNVTAMHGKTVAARGFLPFTEADAPVATAVNFQFTIITSVFHNWTPPEGWTFETRDQYPLGS